MNDALYLDIETVPSQRADVLEDIRAECGKELEAAVAAVKPPSNYGADAAAKWMNEKGNALRAALIEAHEKDVEAAYRKTGLDGAFGQVCAIGYAFNDDTPVVMSGMDERVLLEGFAAELRSCAIKVFDCTVIGHNVTGFDLRFLTQRHIVNGVRPSAFISRAASAKPWEAEKVFDTMVQWAGTGRTVSLDKLCKALGIKSPKGHMDGSRVWDYVKAGALEEVALYCAADVDAVRQVHRRMTFAVQPVAVFDDVPT